MRAHTESPTREACHTLSPALQEGTRSRTESIYQTENIGRLRTNRLEKGKHWHWAEDTSQSKGVKYIDSIPRVFLGGEDRINDFLCC